MTYTLLCYYPTKEDGIFFMIDMEETAFVYTLILRICEMMRKFSVSLDVGNTRVYKV